MEEKKMQELLKIVQFNLAIIYILKRIELFNQSNLSKKMKVFYQLILFDVLQIAVYMQSYCNNYTMEPGGIFISRKENLLIIESDENNIQNPEQDNFNIIEESQRIKKFENEDIISAQIFQLQSKLQIFNNLFCQFLKSEYYFITCIKVLERGQHEREDVIQQSKFKIISNIKDDHMCQEFFYKENYGFILFCFSDFFLKLYVVDFENQTKLFQQFNIENSMYTQCKRKISQISKNKFIIGFVQCSNWAVISYHNEEINEILNKNIAINQSSQEINNLENFEICQNTQVMLFTENNQYIFSIQNGKKLIFLYVLYGESNKKWQLFTSRCSVIYEVQQIPSLNKTIIQNQNYKKEFEGTHINFFLFLDILFVQSTNKLQVIFYKQFQQTININSSKFYFYIEFRLICQIDLVTNEIIFYKFSFPRYHIKPTKKYINLISSQSQSVQQQSQCYEVTYKVKPSQLIQHLKLTYSCQKQYMIFFQKNYLNLITDYQIELQPLNSDLNVAIFDKTAFNSFCLKLNHLQHQEETLLYYEEDNNISFSIFKTQNYIELKSCDGQQQFRVNTLKSQVFQNQNSFVLWQKDNKIIKLTKFQVFHPLNMAFKFKSEIVNIFQYQEIIIVLTKNEDEINLFDLRTLQEKNLFHDIKIALCHLHQMYLQKKQIQQQFQAFYTSEPYEIIQFFQHLVIYYDNKIKFYETEFLQIVAVKYLISRQFYVLGIHLINNLIIEQVVNFDQISTVNEFDCQNYEIIRPLLYQISNYYFAIATRKYSKDFIMLFEISNSLSLKLIKIIEIGRVQFFFRQNYLFYYDSKDQIQKFNMRNFEISITYLEYNSLNNFNRIKFQVIPIDNSVEALNLEINVQSYNYCLNLFKKQHQLTLEKNLIFNLGEYIFGSIDSVQIINREDVQIEGPLLLSEQITNYDILEGVKLKKINLGPDFKNLENLILFQQKNNVIALFKNSEYNFKLKYGYLYNILSINENSLLFLFYKENNSYQLRGAVYLIDEVTNQLISKPISESVIELSFNTKYENFKTGNLIIFKDQFKLEIYAIDVSNIHHIQNNLNIIEILKITGDNQLYISLSLKEKKQILQFQILSLNQMKFQVEGIATILQETINDVLVNYFGMTGSHKINVDYTLRLLECTIEYEKLQITIIEVYQQHSIISLITILQNNFEVHFQPLRVLRNFQIESKIGLKYISNHHLILESNQFSYFYDLRLSDTFDYIGKHSLSQYQNFYLINTTHFIVFDSKLGNLSIGEIGYKIKINDEILNNQSITLLIQNDVSQIQLQMQLVHEVSNDQSQNQFSIRIPFFIIGFLLIVYFFIRRIQLKRKQINQLKHTCIQQNSSES